TRKHPEGFSLISQKDGSVITFLHADTMLLGRNHQGKEYFAAIPQISRSHAKIEFYDNHYRITDMNSSNGTFLGVEKINCKMHPAQSLKDGEILFLGREAFLIQINTRQKYDSQKDAGVFVKIRNANPENLIGNAPAADADHASERKKPYIPAQEFVCKNCYNYKSEIKEFTCPLCNTYNS
ncbi:MAG: FHA domain-containing protein, partial [Spirochaetia bacterium]|nr:FHA domain-containing protein [Spirochaetia bacterium]